jgi:hypothetical protein
MRIRIRPRPHPLVYALLASLVMWALIIWVAYDIYQSLTTCRL